MLALKRFFLISITLFSVAIPLNAGWPWDLLAGLFGSQVLPAENSGDSRSEVVGAISGGNGDEATPNVLVLDDFDDDDIKDADARSNCASSGSVSMSVATDLSDRRLSALLVHERLNGFEQLAVLFGGECAESEDFFDDISPSKYVKIWKNTHVQIFECRDLILQLREKIRAFSTLHHPSDIRMPRLTEDAVLPSVSLQELEEAYTRACSLYAGYLKQAVLLGFGAISLLRVNDSLRLDYPLQLVPGSCCFCEAVLSLRDDFCCEYCGASMIQVPDKRDFGEVSRELRVLLYKINACHKALRSVLADVNVVTHEDE